ncbi:MAG: M28 family peptidase [Patescibacteria group bacterium]|jgi:hypothetical protein
MKNNIFSVNSFTKALVNLGERQGKNEKNAARFLKQSLRSFAIPFREQTFLTKVPVFRQISLMADGKRFSAMPTCFSNGLIRSKCAIFDAVSDMPTNLNEPFIHFNSKCRAISRSIHSQGLSLAVSPEDAKIIRRSKMLKATVRVRSQKYQAINILVGNLRSPKKVIFGHYDSLGPGAFDNASGIAVMLKTIIRDPGLLHDNLFVFAANEELSYDRPDYWGHGYRIFEKKYLKLLQSAKQIVVVDGVGNDKTKIDTSFSVLKEAFPLKRWRTFFPKTVTLYGNLRKMLNIYHSELDTMKAVKASYLRDAGDKLLSILRKI